MSYIRNKEYSKERERPKFLYNYLESMKTYLRLNNPNATDDEIDGFVKNIIRERMNTPTLEVLTHPREGHSKIVEVKLNEFIVKILNDDNLTPSGSVYTRVSKREAFLRKSIDDKVKERNSYKKLYLTYEAEGKKRESQYYYQNQANAKIFNNAIAGGMKITQFILGSKAGFNAITSTGRISVKQGYSYIERAVNGNVFIPTIADAISYVLNHIRHIPETFIPLIHDNVLYIPTVSEVVKYLKTSVDNYIVLKQDATRPLEDVIINLTDVERSYVFYAGCFSNLCKFNEDLMRPWIDSCFLPEKIDYDLYKDINTDDVKSFTGDVIACVLSTNYARLGINPEKPQYNTIKEAAIHNPDGLREFIYACKHFVTNFETLLNVIVPIMKIETTFSKLTFQDRMARYTVPLSDTDSNIFSTQELVRWKVGHIAFNQDAYNMNAITTFILSQSLEHVFARLSSGLGVEGSDVFKISMKNEFLYPILLSTTRGKHYIAIATMQEGSLLPTPRKDIKGVAFRSSAYPKIIRDGFEKFSVDFVNTVTKGKKIRVSSILDHIANLEHTIAQSIKDREVTYLQTVSVKHEYEYKDPTISAHFYYKLWTAVFEKDYGELVLPNKCFKIPLVTEHRLFKNNVFMDDIQVKYPGIHERLVKFLEDNPDKKISAILVPPFRGKVPQFFIDVMDVRDHVSQVLSAYYLFLEGLGIGSVDKRSSFLVSDFHNPLIPLIQSNESSYIE